MKAVAAHAEPDLVYVDLLDEGRLMAITGAMKTALLERWQEFWPSTFESIAVRPIEQRVTFAKDNARPVLVPLDRLGAQQGFSGTSVFIGYYVDASGTYLPSRPLVIKVGEGSKLQDEYGNAREWPPHFSGEDNRFAYPFLLARKSSRSKLAVLLAPFSSEGALDKYETGWRLRLNDLWQLLHQSQEPTRQLLRHVHSVYGLLHGVHREGRVRCTRQHFLYSAEYGWYLRNLQNVLRGIPVALFGSGVTTSAFGEEWPSPGHVVSKILQLPAFEGACGPVHGDLDLHPKNVVLDRHLRPNIIDFGWAQRAGHIVRDYVLMEINLRAVTLPSHLSLDVIRELCCYFTPNDGTVSSDRTVQSRMQLIREGIWRSLSDNGIVEDWNRDRAQRRVTIYFWSARLVSLFLPSSSRNVRQSS